MVEHSGSVSYIVFDTKHIHLTGPTIPPACPYAEQLSKQCNALYQEFERVLEPKQIVTRLAAFLDGKWSQIEDWYAFVDKVDVPAALFNTVTQEVFTPLRQILAVLSPELTERARHYPLKKNTVQGPGLDSVPQQI